jgi:hypothetical protein
VLAHNKCLWLVTKLLVLGTNTVKVDSVFVKMALLVQIVNVLHVNAIHWVVYATLPADANVKLDLKASCVTNTIVTTIVLVPQLLTEQLVVQLTHKLVILAYAETAIPVIAVKQLPAVLLNLVCRAVAVVPVTKAEMNVIVLEDGWENFAMKS